jgi:hypothetical protein
MKAADLESGPNPATAAMQLLTLIFNGGTFNRMKMRGTSSQ